jgi:radical SAM superfamily enzyme YgiQ (UPF0313 family)
MDLSGWSEDDLLKYQENYRETVKSGKYGAVPEDIPFFVFYQSSRGCSQKPRCGFCGSRLGNKYVKRSDEQFYEDVENIIKQISPINRIIHIFDCSDSFMTGIDDFQEYRSFPGVTYTVFARADQITKERAKALKKLGVTKVSIGITSKQNIDAARMLKEEGIQIYANLIYGSPDETPEQIEETVKHFADITEAGDVYRVGARVVTILPRSRWYAQLMNELPDYAEASEDDMIDTDRIQKLWLERKTKINMEDIEKAHKKIVDIAKSKGISISSESPRGIC